VWQASVATLSSAAAVGVGIDLVDQSSFAELHAAGGQAFLDNGWTTAEQRDARGSAEGLAARWAAKEAVMKAMRCGLGDLDPTDIEILTEPDGSPRVELRDSALGAAAALGVCRWHVSLSHDAGWAAAIAIAERSPLRTDHNETKGTQNA
jgi:holo-[acyl-carrier protein] synthase